MTQVNIIKQAHKELSELLFAANFAVAEYETIVSILQDECHNIEHSIFNLLELPDHAE